MVLLKELICGTITGIDQWNYHRKRSDELVKELISGTIRCGTIK